MLPSLSILPIANTVSMYGPSDASTAYSLSGHISISPSSTSNNTLLSRQRSTKILLSSLVLTFEGHSEVITPGIGYAPLRLCALTRELLVKGPEVMSLDGTNAVVFDLPIPGWLPASAHFGSASQKSAGTRYALHATASYTLLSDDEDTAGGAWSWLCAPFQRRTRKIRAEHVDITIERLFQHTDEIASYLAKAAKPTTAFSQIKCVVSVPTLISASASEVPFTIHLTSHDAIASEGMTVKVDLVQTDIYRSIPCTSFAPFIPPEGAQPPHKRLLNPHPYHIMSDLGYFPTPRKEAIHYTHSLLSKPAVLLPTVHADESSTATSIAIMTDLSIRPPRPVPKDHPNTDVDDWTWTEERITRPSTKSPLFGVDHRLRVAITSSTDSKASQLDFFVPVHIVNFESTSQDDKSKSGMVVVQLPAYSMLFESNGDRKVDEYEVPLPIYEAKKPMDISTISNALTPE